MGKNRKGIGGQPTKYRQKYCKMLIEHMADGLSFESFAAIVDVDRDTIYEWAKVQKEFSDAKKQAQIKCLLFWEKKGKNCDKSLNAPVWIYNMKCRFPEMWRDKTEVENTGSTTQTIKHDPQDIKMISEFVEVAKDFMEKNK